MLFLSYSSYRIYSINSFKSITMKTPITLRQACLLVMLISGFSLAEAQQFYRLDASKSSMTVQGTSTVHDWEMNAGDMNASFLLDVEGEEAEPIRDVSFQMPVEALESDRRIMDNKTHDALKANRYSQIRFDFHETTGFRGESARYSGIVTGYLHIAGKKQQVSIPFRMTQEGNGRMVVSGSEQIRMPDFGIDPPTAMMGTLKTGPEVTVAFSLEFVPDRSTASRNP